MAGVATMVAERPEEVLRLLREQATLFARLETSRIDSVIW